VVLRNITQRHRNELEIRNINERLVTQIREIESLHMELREQAIRDGLTGLFNRRYLDEVLPRELERAAYEHNTVSVVMIDIDHFKTINDDRGHREGDRLLALLGDVLRHGTRSNDAACRYGGEEFLLVFPEVVPETALERTESLRKSYATRLRAEGLQAPPRCPPASPHFPSTRSPMMRCSAPPTRRSTRLRPTDATASTSPKRRIAADRSGGPASGRRRS